MSHDRTFTKGGGSLPGDEAPFAGKQFTGEQVVVHVESNEAHQALPELELREEQSPWAWATEHGAPERASTEQLIGWLARGELPAHTLVWRPGWGEWLPALQVAELAAAFPNVTAGNRRVAQWAPAVSNTPPPVPVGHCPRLRLLAKDVVGGSGAPSFASVSHGLVPAQTGRREFRDIDDMQREVVTSQVPAAKMLEAARAMKERGPAAASGSERWARLELGTFGEALPQAKPTPPTRAVSRTLSRAESAATPPGRTLSPHALELDFSELLEPEPSQQRSSRARRYGPWLALGLLLGTALALIAAFERSPEALLAKLTGAEKLFEATTRSAPLETAKAAGADRRRAGEPAALRALTVSDEGRSDRVVFEFHDRMPGYQLGYVLEPVNDCAANDAETLAGDGWLEVRFFPASAHTESGQPSVAEIPVQAGLSSIREIQRTCDSDGVVTWVIRTAARQRFHAYELSAPARFVVDIEH